MYKVSISGKANSGKNTLANILYDEFLDRDNVEISRVQNINWECMALADPIKDIVMTMFPRANRECLYGPSHLRSKTIPGAFKNGKPLTYRQALLDIGTEGRSYNERIWLDNFDYRYDKMLSESEYYLVVVADVRFRNEFEHLKTKGFFQIRLYRDTGLPTIDHVSETNQDSIKNEEFNYVLFNNNSIFDLKNEVRHRIVPLLCSV